MSGLTGWAGMALAVRGNVRCAAAAVHGLNPALRVAFDTGALPALLMSPQEWVCHSVLLLVLLFAASIQVPTNNGLNFILPHRPRQICLLSCLPVPYESLT